MSEAPQLTLHVPVGRNYGHLLQQTKQVYDGLLADKQQKLTEEIVQQKQLYDAKCNMLAQSSQDKALEFGVKAQAELLRKQEAANRELHALRTDYQRKLNTMQQTLEATWRGEKTIQPGGVEVKVYPHK